MLKKKGVVAFDLDGTLVDSLKFSAQYIQQAIFDVEKRLVNEDVIRHEFGKPEERIFKVLCKDGDLNAVIKRYHNLISKNIHEFQLFKGVPEILNALVPVYHLGLYTTRGRKATNSILKANHIDSCFGITVTGDEVEFLKPHPEGLIKIADFFKISMKEICYIGDSEPDMEMTRHCGATGVFVVPREYGGLIEEISKRLRPLNALFAQRGLEPSIN